MAAETALETSPGAELLCVDRRAWIGGNARTLDRLFGDLGVSGAEAKLVGLEGGALFGLLARAVLAQYDPFRDQLIVVYPNLGAVGRGNGLRWLLFHEVTHLAQFRSAPWMPDYIAEGGRSILGADSRDWMRDAAKELRTRLPDIIRMIRDAIEGKPGGDSSGLLLEVLPDEQRETVERLHALVTLLEGHATYVTDLIARRVIDDYPALKRRIEAQRKRPPLIRVLETLAGLELKRQQYVLGRSFCEHVWERGGAEALAPAWSSPEAVPTLAELRDPARWLDRVAA